MGSDYEFGPDTDAIRRWLSQRDTYRSDPGRHRGEADPQQEATRASDPPSSRAATPAPPAPPPPRPTAATDVGRSILEALGDVTPPTADEATTATPTGVDARLDALITPPAAPDAPGPTATEQSEAEVDEVPPAAPAAAADREPSGMSTDQVFEARSTARRIMGVILLLTLGGAVVAGYLAYQDPSTGTYGIAATLAVLTLAVWAVRASTTSTQVQVKRGVLEVRRGGGLEVADLSNPFTPIAILGAPERRNWRVLVERVDRPLIEIDASMVDPILFTGLLLRLRPELWDAPVDDVRFSAAGRRS